MAHQINTLYKIHTGLYGSVSSTYGLYGGYNTLKTSVSVGASTIVTNVDTNNFYIYPELDKIKITDGVYSEFLTVSSCTKSLSPLQYTISTYQPLQNSYTSASTTVYIESYFGWSEFNQSVSHAVYGDFTKAQILDVPEIERSIDVSSGGNVQNETGGSLKINNTNQFSKYLTDNSIYLNGCRIDCLMSISNSYYQLGTYKIDKTSYTAEEYEISFSPFNRNATITNKINSTDNTTATKDLIGTSIPVVFGNNYPTTSWDGYAKFIRSADVKSDIEFEPNCDSWSTGIYFVTSNLTGTIKCFPCVDVSSTTVRRQYKFAIGSGYEGIYNVYSGASHLTSGTHDLDLLTDKYAYVTKGQENGEYRKIESAYIDLDYDSDGHTIVINFADYFKNVLKSNVTATETDNSWIKIINANREYVGETWPCYSFLNSNGVSISANYEVYSYLENKTSEFDVSGSAEKVNISVNEKDVNFTQLPTTTFTIIDSELNSIKTSFRQASNDLDSFDSYIIKPMVSITQTPLNSTEYDERYSIFGGYETIADGVFADGYISTGWTIGSNYSDIIDGNSDTYHQIYADLREMVGTDKSEMIVSYDLTFPEIDFEFDNIYLGVKIKFDTDIQDIPLTLNHSQLSLVAKQFMGAREQVDFLDTSIFVHDAWFDDMPDEYFYPSVNTNNKYFYSNDTLSDVPLIDPNGFLSGYSTYDISSIFTNETYGTHKYVSLFFWNSWDDGGAEYQGNSTFKFYECCLIFNRKSSTKKQLYIPFAGRKFNDTWSSRKTSGSLINNPVDTLEHTLRLQNRSDFDASTAQPGKEYSYVPMIETSYIDSNLADRKYTNAFSVTDYDKSNTEYIKKELCRQFGLISFTGLNGYEKIYPYNGFAPSLKTFTLSNIVDRKSISVKEPDVINIYCEPFVQYNYNIAADKYDGYIAITNVHKSTYSASYVIGMTSDQETYWNLCRAAYIKYKNIQKPPDSYTKLSMINGTNAQYYAQLYFTNWINSMSLCDYTFDVHIADCFGLNIGDYITINFPHHTNGTNKSGIITKIIYKLKNNYANTITVRC